MTRRLSLILPLLALPGLLGCRGDQVPAKPQPPSEAAIAAISGQPGVSRDRLARAIDALFDPEAVGDTRALLILRRGEIVAERYRPGYDGDTRFLGWSASQCLTGIMIGMINTGNPDGTMALK